MIQATTNAAQVGAELEQLAESIEKAGVEWIQAAAKAALPAIRERTPKRTGRLAASWSFRPLPRGARIHNSAPYAGGVQGGGLPPMAVRAIVESMAEEPPSFLCPQD